MAPVRVMHLITDLEIGGAEMMLSRLVCAADNRRVQMSVVSMTTPGTIGACLTGEGVSVHALGMGRGLPDPRGLGRLVALLRRQPVDVLQTWLYHADLLGLLAARLAGVPRLLWNLRCSDMQGGYYSRVSAALPWLLARLSRQPDLVLANSESGRAYHEALGYHPHRWQVLPNGIDTDRFRPDGDARRRLCADFGLSPESFLICLPARVDPMKDHATFFAAAARFARGEAGARFILAGRGTGPGDPALRALVAESGCADRLMSLGERREMPSLLAAVDVVTLSSAFGEGFPNVLGEAMACAIPVVSTDVGDAAQIIGPTGLIVPPRDPVALAAAWQKLHGMEAGQRAAIGIAGRQRVIENYSLAVIVARYEALYEEMAPSARAPAAAGASAR
ncbi:MAG: glycosyltransferase [Stellaceae bacterium]